MRIAFVKTLIELARKDPSIMLLTGDLGYSVFEEYMTLLPKQYINCGIAEQNMTGVAAGLAIEGKKPIVYSIVPFSTMRNFEQIRNDVCYQNMNVKFVGVGAGFSYGPYGHTHHGLEDIAVLRSLPNMVIFTPGDPVEVKLATREMLRYHGACYLRIGKAGEKVLHTIDPEFKIGKGIVIRKGRDIALLGISTMLETTIMVADLLKSKNIDAAVISMPTVKPIDNDLICTIAQQTKALVTIEEHFICGGLGSAVSEVLAENKIQCTFKRFGVPDRFTKEIGNQEYMRRKNGLGSEQITEEIMRILSSKQRAK